MITENQLKHCFWKIAGDDTKKTKRLTEIEVLTEDFTSYKIRHQKESNVVTNQLLRDRR